MIRPEVIDALRRWRELLFAAGFVALGLWVAQWGGYILVPLGLIIGAYGASAAVVAVRRMGFSPGPGSPGVVEVVEGRIAYFGPEDGGFVSLPEMSDLRLIVHQDRRLWRLREAGGNTLMIPVDAMGADALFDAFASLPGMDTGRLASVLSDPSQRGASLSLALTVETRPVWRKPKA